MARLVYTFNQDKEVQVGDKSNYQRARCVVESLPAFEGDDMTIRITTTEALIDIPPKDIGAIWIEDKR